MYIKKGKLGQSALSDMVCRPIREYICCKKNPTHALNF